MHHGYNAVLFGIIAWFVWEFKFEGLGNKLLSLADILGDPLKDTLSYKILTLISNVLTIFDKLSFVGFVLLFLYRLIVSDLSFILT